MAWKNSPSHIKEAERRYYLAHRAEIDRYRKEWRKAHPTNMAIARRKWRAKNRDRDRANALRWCRDNREWVNLKTRLSFFGLTLDQYHAKLEAQEFTCAFCDTEDNLQIDHCHDSKRIRGLLCNNHNSGLGHFQHDPARLELAASYLRRYASS